MVLTAADLAGLALIAGATLAGAWLGRRFGRLRTICLACAAVALVAVVAADLVPDIWNDLRETGLPWWIAAAGARGRHRRDRRDHPARLRLRAKRRGPGQRPGGRRRPRGAPRP